MGYFKVRVRTHEWVEGEPVSLLDIQGIGKTRMNLLYKEGYSTASRIMRAPVDDLVARLSVYDAFLSRSGADAGADRRLADPDWATLAEQDGAATTRGLAVSPAAYRHGGLFHRARAHRSVVRYRVAIVRAAH
jgi:hypothetical protein